MKQSKSKTTPHIKETDLDPPLREFLTGQGFEVHSEVKHCDIVAAKGEELVIVEMKSHFNATLLIQAVKRQQMTEQVYLAIPRPRGNLRRRQWKDLCHLVRRLELGLLLVDPESRQVEVAVQPEPFDRAQSLRQGRKKTGALLNEVRERHGDYNVGGSCRRKLMTAYKENSFQIACYLQLHGPLSPKQLQIMGTGKKTASILQKNFYGWFERIATGVYQLTPSGAAFLPQYPDLVTHFQNQLAARQPNHVSQA